MNKSEEAVQYMISVWDEVTGGEWRKSPDHVQQKFLAAEKPSEIEKYEIECKEFEQSMRQKEANFSFVIATLKNNIDILKSAWMDDPIGMSNAFEKRMKNELNMSRHCDRPNKPGYYRANND